MNKRHLLLALAGLLALSPALPAEAATLPAASFSPGQTLGVGLAGLSYDYAFPGVLVGASLANNAFTAGQGRFQLGTRAMVRFLDTEALDAGLVGGLMFDPGVVGGRSYLVPDLGVGVSYAFSFYELPLTLSFNVTLTADQGQSNPYYVPQPTDPAAMQPRGNFFQRLTTGPLTMIGLAYRPNENLEVTVGSGTLVGVRFNY